MNCEFVFVVFFCLAWNAFVRAEEIEIVAEGCLEITPTLGGNCVTMPTVTDTPYVPIATLNVSPQCTSYVGNKRGINFVVTSAPAAVTCADIKDVYMTQNSGGCDVSTICPVTGDVASGCTARCPRCPVGGDCGIVLATTTRTQGLDMCNLTLHFWRDVDTSALSNVAVGKTATSSGDNYGGVASRANDGDTNSHFQSGQTCMHAADVPYAWWKVSLGDDYVITHVIVTSRGDCQGTACSSECYCDAECASWMANFEIRVGNDVTDFKRNSLCHFRSGTMGCGVTEVLPCEGPLVIGREVSLQVGDPDPVVSDRRSLTFCELQAFGFKVEP